MKRIVIKLGGALFAQGIDNLVNDLKTLINEYQFIIVHGGGPQITNLGKQMGKEPKMYNTPQNMKTRYTDKDQMDIVKMALAGYVNKTVVESLRKVGVNAFGFSGLDGGCIVAERKDQILVLNERGNRQVLHGEFSGKVKFAKPELIEMILEKNMVPVIACMSGSEAGDAVNVDGDRAAVAVAIAIKADKYVSLTDVEGIYKDMESKEVITKMSQDEAEKFMEQVGGGMKKKMFAALEGLKGEVKEFVVYSGVAKTPLSDVLKENKGTIISK
jgi:acetylglutamate/LysW-gamma-L-alpha-aminoadipate kinase